MFCIHGDSSANVKGTAEEGYDEVLLMMEEEEDDKGKEDDEEQKVEVVRWS